MNKNVHQRLDELEIKYKWMESVMAEMNSHLDKLLYKTDSEKPKKQRLWSATAPIPRDVKYIDVMYNDGRIDENYYIGNMPHMGPTVLAWREAK